MRLCGALNGDRATLPVNETDLDRLIDRNGAGRRAAENELAAIRCSRAALCTPCAVSAW